MTFLSPAFLRELYRDKLEIIRGLWVLGSLASDFKYSIEKDLNLYYKNSQV
jgi:hypothetical protein